ncbi:TPA: hypothetical protein N0F65_002400 [Lagenidium giganteum]|uniref:Lipoyl-binding domain-containing protein n=1 Tax=Lagenidium giganteum TaxID=4803 RepID=A0AAV2YJK6_9STRA|nr:TPA: hypothetical protein N0F65_002400 [Lagenidium giganteum]
MLRLALRTAAAVPTRRCASASIAKRAFASYPPHEVVGLPALSPTMEQGNLAKWRMKEGDRITAGDIICEIETDKAVVDYEAQDDMFLARILVPEGTEGIAVGQPIMVTCDEEEYLAGLKDFKVDETQQVAEAQKRAPEEIPPPKEAVPVDPASGAPVVPGDFLVTSQTTQKLVPGPAIPAAPVAVAAPAPVAPQPAVASVAASLDAPKWGTGLKRSPLSASLLKKHQAYIDLYGITGTTPLASK